MLSVECDRGVSAELSDYFSFYVPGYKFMPAFRHKVWDGKIRLFNQLTGELNAGLYIYLLKFAIERGYLVETNRNDWGLPGDKKELDLHRFNSFVEALDLPFLPRDYQYEAVVKGIQRRRTILLSPTGSGKSLIIYMLMKWVLQEDTKSVLIVVPTTSLVEQMYSDFKDYGMNVADEVHRIYSGKDKVTKKRIIVSTWQSIYKFPKAWFAKFGMVVGDECHGFKSKSLSSIMNKCENAEYRYGTTGTLDGTQTHKLVLEGLFGPVVKVTSTKKLQDDETLAPLNISILLLDYPEDVKKNFGQRNYQDEIDWIVGNNNRNKFIRNLALDVSGNTLVLFRLVDHGKLIFNLIKEKSEEKRKIFFVSGETDTRDREQIRKIVEKQKNAIIVASLGTFSTGINIRNLHNIIFASPSKSQIRVLQSIGRGLRKTDDGKSTHLYDIADDLSWKKRKNFTLTHSGERIKIYNKEQFEYKTIRVQING